VSRLRPPKYPPLEPGLLAQVVFDLPVGMQPEGEAFYTLNTDENGVLDDVETNNSTASFAVNLWLDNDADGMPNSYEIANGFDSDNPNDALDDADKDGMNNYAEWRAGTDPHDEHSYLMVESLASIADSVSEGIRLTCGSVSNRFYRINRASNLVNGRGFSPIATHILATPPVNTYIDTSASTNTGPFFYAIEVE